MCCCGGSGTHARGSIHIKILLDLLTASNELSVSNWRYIESEQSKKPIPRYKKKHIIIQKHRPVINRPINLESVRPSTKLLCEFKERKKERKKKQEQPSPESFSLLSLSPPFLLRNCLISSTFETTDRFVAFYCKRLGGEAAAIGGSRTFRSADSSLRAALKSSPRVPKFQVARRTES